MTQPAPMRLDATENLSDEEVAWVYRRYGELRFKNMEALAGELKISASLLSKVLNRQRRARPILRQRMFDVLSKPQETTASVRAVVREELNAAALVLPARAVRARPVAPFDVPVLYYGMAGDPLEALDVPSVSERRPPPAEIADDVGVDGFGVIIRGDSLLGLGIQPGDVAWCERVDAGVGVKSGECVAAVVSDDEEDSGLRKCVVKVYGEGDDGATLWSVYEAGRRPAPWQAFELRGRVVGVEIDDGRVFLPPAPRPSPSTAIDRALAQLGHLEERDPGFVHYLDWAMGAGVALEITLRHLLTERGEEPDLHDSAGRLATRALALGVIDDAQHANLRRWIDTRNRAAHKPDGLTRQMVREAVEGVRAFLTSRAP